MEYRIVVSLARHGRADVAEHNAELLLEAFQEAHPEAGPVVGAIPAHETLDVTFSLDARNPDEAFQHGRRIFDEGIRRTKLSPIDIRRIEVEAVADVRPQGSELQPA